MVSIGVNPIQSGTFSRQGDVFRHVHKNLEIGTSNQEIYNLSHGTSEQIADYNIPTSYVRPNGNANDNPNIMLTLQVNVSLLT